MPEITDDALARYFAVRERQRADQVEQTLSALSERERSLVSEAAIMGFVQGHMAAGGVRRVPPDSHILTLVVTGCLSHKDRYPTITGYTEEPDDA